MDPGNPRSMQVRLASEARDSQGHIVMRAALTLFSSLRLPPRTSVGSRPLARLALVATALLLAAGCAQAPPAEPTPDIDAIVQAAVAKAMAAETPVPTPDVPGDRPGRCPGNDGDLAQDPYPIADTHARPHR